MQLSDSTNKWTPGLASRAAVLQNKLDNSDHEGIELEIPDLTTRTLLGLDRMGALWLNIECDPRVVDVDDASAAVRFDLRPNGYRITVAPTASQSVAVHFLDEVVQLIADGAPPGTAGRDALQGWRELLARPAGAPLGEKALVGLYGELEVLEIVLANGGDLDSWTGWNSDHADFRLSGLVIEVKSTTSSNFRRVQIHGLGQLDDPQDGSRLVLVLRRLESSADGRSVPDLTDSIVRLGAPRSVLLDRLAQVGYLEVHRSHYEQVRFVSEEIALRNIDSDHPRLVPSMLSNVDLSSVDKINYELNLNGTADADLGMPIEQLLQEGLGDAG